MGYVLGFQEVDQTQIASVGGKGALLGELSRIDGISVPNGFCVTTDAFQRVMQEAPQTEDWLDQLSKLEPDDQKAISELSGEIRHAIEGVACSEDVASAITRGLASLGVSSAYAVRSSATTEDSPTASFAGQHETYLNVVGEASILERVNRCWASLFSERAVIYRLRNGFDHRKARMAVVVQQMAFPRAAGTLFTADPVTSNRRVSAVEASFGLGEGLVSGRARADGYRVRDGEIVAKALAAKRLAIRALPEGGTEEQPIEREQERQPALTDAQVVQLAQLGRRIEAHFGRPQDIEWCLDHDGFKIVQSRPITALFPIPRADDRDGHVYVSVGHQQMMTDPMKPLGLSVFQLTALRPMHEAGGRLFVDVTRELASRASRVGIINALGTSDPLIGTALQAVVERGDFIQPLSDEAPGAPPLDAPAPTEVDPAVVAELIEHSQASVATLKREIRAKSAGALLDFILADIEELKRILLDPRNQRVIRAAMGASLWLNKQMEAWLGEKNAADTLTLSVPHNVTSEMGLALLDVADVVREHPNVAAFLRDVEDESFLERLPMLTGGGEVRDAIRAYLDEYGMRCVGEIDITRQRWSERPTTLLPMILGNVENFEPGAGKGVSSKGCGRRWRRRRTCWSGFGPCPRGSGRQKRPSG